MASSRDAIERSAPHIYLSALPFADKNGLVYQEFASRCTGLIKVDLFGIGHHGGNAVMTLTGHGGPVNSVAYSSDGQLIASGSNDGTVRLWNTQTGEEAMTPLNSDHGFVLSVDFAPNGKWVASGTNVGVVCIWNPEPGRTCHRRLSGHSMAVKCVAFSFDSSRLASASEDKTARLWNPETGEQLATMSGHSRSVNGVVFSPTGEKLATISDDGTIRLWHGTTGKAARDPLENAGYDGVDFSPNGEMIAGTFADVVKFTRCTTGEKLASLSQETKKYSIRFAPDGRSLVAACGRAVRLWSVHPELANALWYDLGVHASEVNRVTFSPDGLYIASASDDSTIRIWNAGSGQLTIQPLAAHASPVNTVEISQNGIFIVTGSRDRLMRKWDANTGDAMLPPLQGHSDWIRSVSIAPDERLIASASDDHTIRIWDAQSGATVGKPMHGHTSWVWDVKFSHDGCWLASASEDNTVRMWDVATQQSSALGPLHCHDEAKAVAISPDDKIVAAGDGSGRIYLWRADTGEQAYEPLHAGGCTVWSLAFSPDGTRIVSSRHENTACIWDVNEGHCVQILQGHMGVVRSVAWSYDGLLIGTGSYDSTLRLWNPITGAPLAMLLGHDKPVTSVAFTRDRHFIVSGSDDFTIRKWDLNMASNLGPEPSSDPITALASAHLVDGWLVGSSGELILWVPAKYRRYLQVYPCTLRIDRSRVAIGVSENRLFAGTNWSLCWHGSLT